MDQTFCFFRNYERRLIIVLGVLLSIFYAQKASAVSVFRIDPTPVMTTSGNVPFGGFPALYAVANATIQICTDSACAIPATAYSDVTGNTACPINAPVTLPGTTTCVSTSGPQGQFGFWVQAGTYYFKIITPAGVSSGPFPISVSGTPASVTLPFALASSFAFSQAPGGSLTGGMSQSVNLVPCPSGVSGSDSNHYLYISGGTGAAETVLITGGTCAGAGNGTITFTPGNTHSGTWTIASATGGIQEAHNNLSTANGGTIYLPPGQTTMNGCATISTSGVSLLGTGSGLTSWGAGTPPSLNASRLFQNTGANLDCVIRVLNTGAFTAKDFAINGNSANQTAGLGHGLWINQTIAGFQFQDAFENVGIEQTRGIGFNATMLNPGAAIVRHVSARNTGDYCMQLAGVSDWDVDQVNAGGCGSGHDVLLINGSQRVRVSNSTFYSGARYGISIASNSSKIMLDHDVVDNNANAGIALLGTASGSCPANALSHISIVGGESTNNGNLNPPAIQASGVYMTNVVCDVIVDGLRTYNDPSINNQQYGIGIESSVTGGNFILANTILRKRASGTDRGNVTGEILNNSALPFVTPSRGIVGCISATVVCTTDVTNAGVVGIPAITAESTSGNASTIVLNPSNGGFSTIDCDKTGAGTALPCQIQVGGTGLATIGGYTNGVLLSVDNANSVVAVQGALFGGSATTDVTDFGTNQGRVVGFGGVTASNNVVNQSIIRMQSFGGAGGGAYLGSDATGTGQGEPIIMVMCTGGACAGGSGLGGGGQIMQMGLRNTSGGGVLIGSSGTVPATGGLTATGAVIFSGLTSAGAQDYVCFNTGTSAIVQGTAPCTASSERYKHDFEPLDAGLDTVLKLPTYSYVRNDHPEIGRQTGLKAEDVYAIDPRLVGLDEEGRPDRVRYDTYTAVLTKAIQDLYHEVEMIKRQCGDRCGPN